MIIHSTIMRFRDGYKMVGMMGVRKYAGGDLSGIGQHIYEMEWPNRFYYFLRYRKHIKYYSVIYCDTKNAEEWDTLIKHHNMFVKHKIVKSYKVVKTTFLLQDYEMSMLKLIG